MQRRRRDDALTGTRLVAAIALTVLLLGAPSCGGSESGEEADAELDVFYVGVASGLRAALDDFEEQTGISVHLTGSANFTADIVRRVGEGDPPDVALFPQPALIDEFARQGDLVPLSDDVVAAVDRNYAPGARELGEVEGELYGVFYLANVKSLVWYRPAVFDERGYTVPETWDELVALTERMNDEGTTPWCFAVRALGGESGWPGTDWIEDLVLHRFGGEVYDDWVDGEVPFDDPRIEEAFMLFDATTLEPGQTFNGRSGILSTLWNRSGEPLFTDPPGCLLHRVPSFWRASLPEGTSIGPDGDVDVFPLPVLDEEVGEAVLVGGDTAAAFTDREEAMMLLEYLASPESGEPWAAEGGYISPHRNFDVANYSDPFDRRLDDVIGDASLLRFDGSDLMPVAVGERTFREGMLHFIRTRDFPSTVRIIEAGFERDSGS